MSARADEPLGMRSALRPSVVTGENGSTIGGRYRVYGRAQGGLGAVYFVVDSESNTPLALKTPMPKAGIAEGKLRSLYRRFEGEAEVWAGLGNHPNIVRCHYLTVVDGIPYVALEWVAERGRSNASLSGFIRAYGKIAPQPALDFALDICRGLLHAQAVLPGFVHRDLKPDNVLITAQRIAKVTDFGFAQFDGKPLANGRLRYRSTAIVGTPRYMAPEQWKHGLVDERADVYAMGSILYEMLTGAHLFEFTTRGQWRDAHCSTPPPHLPTDLPPSLDHIVQRCLAKLSEDRFATVADLSDALTALYRSEFGEEPRAVPEADDLTVEDLSNLGNTRSYLGDVDGALEAYAEAIAMQPGFAAAHYGRGIAFNALGRHTDALSEYAAALETDPAHVPSLYNRANTLVELHQPLAAKDAFDAALAVDPSLAEALYNRGLLSLEEGDELAAVNDFDAAIAHNPFPAALRTRASLHVAAGRFDAAITDLSGAIEREDDRDLVLADRLVRAELFRRRRDLRRAVLDYNAIIDAGAATAETYYQRGVCLASLGRHTAAVSDMTRALQGTAEPAKAYRARAAAFAELGQHEFAIADYARITELDPNDISAYYEIGLILGIQGRFREALAFLDAAARRGHPEAETALRRFGYREQPVASPRRKPQEVRT